MVKKKTSGWFGNSSAHKQAGKTGGEKTWQLYGHAFFQAIGKKGGKVSPGNFKFNPHRAKQMGKRGGKSKTNRTQ